MQLHQALTDCKGLRDMHNTQRFLRTNKILYAAGSGQSTVEFAIVGAALLCIAVGLASMLHLFDEGAVLQHAIQSASHHVSSGDAGAWGDVLAY